MRLSEMQSKKVIDIISGSNVGTIVDAFISDDGKVESFIIDQGKNLFSLNRESDVKVLWSHIMKIGEDVILIKKDT